MSATTLLHQAPYPGTTGVTSRVAFALRHLGPAAAATLPGVIVRGAASQGEAPAVYLTFDDGPDDSGTPLLLNRLAGWGARASFFVLAGAASGREHLLREIVDAGHDIGVHGWDHTDPWRKSDATSQMERAAAWLEDATGRPIRDVRPPYGRLTPATYVWARRTGRRVVLWDSMPGDFAPGSNAVLTRRLETRLRPGSIVAMHDGRPAARAARALENVVPRWIDAGWCMPSLAAG